MLLQSNNKTMNCFCCFKRLTVLMLMLFFIFLIYLFSKNAGSKWSGEYLTRNAISLFLNEIEIFQAIATAVPYVGTGTLLSNPNSGNPYPPGELVDASDDTGSDADPTTVSVPAIPNVNPPTFVVNTGGSTLPILNSVYNGDSHTYLFNSDGCLLPGDQFLVPIMVEANISCPGRPDSLANAAAVMGEDGYGNSVSDTSDDATDLNNGNAVTNLVSSAPTNLLEPGQSFYVALTAVIEPTSFGGCYSLSLTRQLVPGIRWMVPDPPFRSLFCDRFVG